MKDDFNTRLNEIQVQHSEEIELLKLTINELTGRIELLENKPKKAEKQEYLKEHMQLTKFIMFITIDFYFLK